jgi:hypothetical protein
MKPTFEQSSARRILRDGITKGYWTMEQLDNAPPGTKLTLKEWSRHPMNQSLKIEQPCYRNLLRDTEENPQDDFIL